MYNYGDINVQFSARQLILYFTDLDTQWKVISQKTVTVNKTFFIALHTSLKCG